MPESPKDRLAATLAVDGPVTSVLTVSTGRAQALGRLGIKTVRDLVTHFPRRYLDLTDVCTVASAKSGKMCTINGSVHEVKLKRPRRNLPIVEVALVDRTGTLIVSFFHQVWLKDKLSPGQSIAVAGKVDISYGFKRMTNPYLEIIEDQLSEGAVIPVHPATERLAPSVLRRIVSHALTLTFGMFDPLPVYLRKRRGLSGRFESIKAMHFPKVMEEVEQARKRLVYEEVFLLQLHLISEDNMRRQGADPVRHNVSGKTMEALSAAIPFNLTSDQKAAKCEILESLAANKVSNRMVLGDVGTGKTIVAAFAFAAAKDTGGQAMLMAPTEVLARQHAEVLGGLFDKCGIKWALLTGSTKAQMRQSMLSGFLHGTLDVLVGTHALLEDDVKAKNLVLAVIDEQQRFGVDQRAKILSKGKAADALYLTATPIPRSLALALFGNLELTYMKERPFSQTARKTVVLHRGSKGKAYDFASRALAKGEQVYVVCPLIGMDSLARDKKTKNGKSSEDADDAYHPSVAIEDAGDFADGNPAAAATEARFLQESVFPDYKVGLLHGGLASDEKSKIMGEFRDGGIDVLVSTTVIEVGIDVPNATVMIIEDADRFGLSQLHQLRGRVGRGDLGAHVFLISSSKTEGAMRRLSALEKSDDGFELAQYDLALRREGDILGNRQSGASALKLVNVIRDADLIEQAHDDAMCLLHEDPLLELPGHKALAREVRLLFKGEKPPLGG